MQTNTNSHETDPIVKTILGREKVLELIEVKKTCLALVFPEFQPVFDDTGLYQTPDNGWQVNFRHDLNRESHDNAGWNYAAMTLRPGTCDLFEVHGAICGKWYAEGGVWDNSSGEWKNGWLGWPVSDELTCEGDDRISFFENGTIFWDSRQQQVVARSWEETRKLFCQEADRGCAWAQLFLGDCLLRGLGIQPDYSQAFKWLSIAKENGSAEAEARLQLAARKLILSL